VLSNVPLGPGPQTANYNRTVRAFVSDALGAVVTYDFVVRVAPPADVSAAKEAVTASVTDIVANGDSEKLVRRRADNSAKAPTR
jgi:hypothetical protein